MLCQVISAERRNVGYKTVSQVFSRPNDLEFLFLEKATSRRRLRFITALLRKSFESLRPSYPASTTMWAPHELAHMGLLWAQWGLPRLGSPGWNNVGSPYRLDVFLAAGSTLGPSGQPMN